MGDVIGSWTWRRVALSSVVGIVVGLGSVGCGGPSAEELPEWTPADHQNPNQGVGPGQAGGPPPDQVAPPEEDANADPVEREARAAAALFNVSCGSCHGRDGRGGGPAMPPGAQIPDLGDASWQSARTDEAIAQVITTGRGLMPPFGTQINERGIAALVKHVRSLARSR